MNNQTIVWGIPSIINFLIERLRKKHKLWTMRAETGITILARQSHDFNRIPEILIILKTFSFSTRPTLLGETKPDIILNGLRYEGFMPFL